MEWVNSGEEVAISFGKKMRIVASIVPASQEPEKNKEAKPVRKNAFVNVAVAVRRPAGTEKERPLGLLEGKATVVFAENFKMTEEEFLGV